MNAHCDLRRGSASPHSLERIYGKAEPFRTGRGKAAMRLAAQIIDKSLPAALKVKPLNRIPIPKTEVVIMSANEPAKAKPAKTFDSAYSFSFAIAIGLLLFIAGLVISLTLGASTTVGLIFGIPLLIAGMAVPMVMLRGQFAHTDVQGPCPYCKTPIKTTDASIRLECPTCHRLMIVRDLQLYPIEE
ncbi:MAG TPA: hypothetical protein VJU84_15065 [Pyrinomonadaceae bacterium]|nr:hypothetical protein [Pyrinomonadaceae bacterium]